MSEDRRSKRPNDCSYCKLIPKKMLCAGVSEKKPNVGVEKSCHQENVKAIPMLHAGLKESRGRRNVGPEVYPNRFLPLHFGGVLPCITEPQSILQQYGQFGVTEPCQESEVNKSPTSRFSSYEVAPDKTNTPPNLATSPQNRESTSSVNQPQFSENPKTLLKKKLIQKKNSKMKSPEQQTVMVSRDGVFETEGSGNLPNLNLIPTNQKYLNKNVQQRLGQKLNKMDENPD